MIDFFDAKRVAGMLAAVGEPTRMMILYRLAQGPHHVGQLATALGVPMVNMSHHLGVMRQAGLLDDEKDGRRVVYRFRPEIYTPGNGADPDVLATLTLGLYRLVIRRNQSGGGLLRARAKRKPVARRAAAKRSTVASVPVAE
jgi:DNA-binding transcriptional ArsR family regulator